MRLRHRARVNSAYYCQHVLGDSLLPDICIRCLQYTWNLQQNCAPPHDAENTIAYLWREYITSEPVTLNSPDIKPFDYTDRGALQQTVYRRRRLSRAAPARDHHHHRVDQTLVAVYWPRHQWIVSPAEVRHPATKDTLNTYCDWNSKHCCVLSQVSVLCLKLSNISVTLNVIFAIHVHWTQQHVSVQLCMNKTPTAFNLNDTFE